ncbi:MAG: CoA transferase [Betaproteobacteria bacterium]
MTSGAALDRPLHGLRVLERATGVAAQYCGRLLAVLGAEVTKVEPPGGCVSRRVPPLLHTADQRHSSVLFEYLNVEKRSVTLRDDDEQGQRGLATLLERADVFVDDTPVPRREAQGLDPDAVCSRYPHLVYLSVLPFGAYGPLRDFVGSEIALFHSAGEGYLMPNGLALEKFPDRPPVKIYGHFAEIVGGTSAAGAAIVAALAQLDGKGQFVDVSVQDANVAIGCFALQRLGDGVVENRHARSFKYGGVLECQDGHVELLVLEQHQWLGLMALMGHPAWAAEFIDPMERGRRGSEINRYLRAWALQWTVADLVRSGQAAKVPIAPYNDAPGVLNSPQNLERGVFTQATFEGMAREAMMVAPFRFPAQPLKANSPAPAAGAHNAVVFSQEAP